MSSAAFTRFGISDDGVRRSSSPKATFRYTVMWGHSAYD